MFCKAPGFDKRFQRMAEKNRAKVLSMIGKTPLQLGLDKVKGGKRDIDYFTGGQANYPAVLVQRDAEEETAADGQQGPDTIGEGSETG
eukprot:COSAG04_NODE_9441_length_864_cov_0.779085_2_plen_87_part_01